MNGKNGDTKKRGRIKQKKVGKCHEKSKRESKDERREVYKGQKKSSRGRGQRAEGRMENKENREQSDIVKMVRTCAEMLDQKVLLHGCISHLKINDSDQHPLRAALKVFVTMLSKTFDF